MVQGERLINPDEKARVQENMSLLREAKEGTDHRLIRERIDQLDKATIKLAELLMDSSLRSGLKDKKFSELP